MLNPSGSRWDVQRAGGGHLFVARMRWLLLIAACPEVSAELAFREPAVGEQFTLDEHAGREHQTAAFCERPAFGIVETHHVNPQIELLGDPVQYVLCLVTEAALLLRDQGDQSGHELAGPDEPPRPVRTSATSASTGTYIVYFGAPP